MLVRISLLGIGAVLLAVAACLLSSIWLSCLASIRKALFMGKTRKIRAKIAGPTLLG